MENYEYHRTVKAIQLRAMRLNVTKPRNFSRTTKSYQKELDDANRNIDVIGIYINAKTKIIHKCRKCSCEWDAVPSSILRGTGCPKCNGGTINRTTESYQKELDDNNRHIDVLGQYINAITKIIHKCKKCSYEWEAVPHSILAGNGCPKCAKNIKKDTKSYQKELDDANRNIDVLGQYVGANIKIIHKCRVCGYEWDVVPGSVLHGCGCPKCSKRLKKDTTSYQKELDDNNRNIDVLGIYVNTKTKITHKCRKCEYEWNATPDSILSGCGCPECGRMSRTVTIRKQISKKIKCIETECVFSSLTEAAQYYHINHSALSNAVRKNTKCAGYHWKYVEEEDETNEKS